MTPTESTRLIALADAADVTCPECKIGMQERVWNDSIPFHHGRAGATGSCKAATIRDLVEAMTPHTFLWMQPTAMWREVAAKKGKP